MKTLELSYDSLEALQTDAATNLRKARAFVQGAHELAEREPCELVLIHPQSGARLALQAEAVYASADGVGVELTGLDDETRRAIEAFAGDEEEPGATRAAPTLQERIRKLSNREREEIARHGSLSERVALERAFAGTVWEALLANPQLTPPEVARIAKNGTLPKPLVGTIVANPSWLGIPEVQRALLGNPRCSGPHLDRVLRAVKPAELLRLSQTCPYRQEVKAAAQRLVR